MFGIGTWELVVIFILALIILGPQQLPKVAKTLGQTLGKLRRTAEEVKREVNLDALKEEIMPDDELKDLKQSLDVRSEVRRAVAQLDAPPPPVSPYGPPAPKEAPAEPAKPGNKEDERPT
jgi:sec-independent protein translocase protein TatB